MKHLVICLLCLLGCGGCKTTEMDVRLIFLNVCGREIYVEHVRGLSHTPPVGYLPPSPDDGEFSRLNETSATFFEPVRVADVIQLKWREGGEQHQVDLKRDELNLPAKLKHETVRFVYHGNDKWRIALVK